MNVFLAILILPGLVCLYAMVLRPILHRIPAFQKFYDDADTFWGKAWAVCGKSMTILWSYLVGGIGTLFAGVDMIGPIVGDPNLDLETKVKTALNDHPSIAGWALIVISVVTIAARVRTISSR